MDRLQFSASIEVECAPQDLYDLVSDVTRTGQWSPTCTACWWDEGGGPAVGAWFTGRNETPQRTWETRCQVLVAQRGREFTFAVGGDWVRWSYTFTPAAVGTRLAEEWEYLPAGLARHRRHYGERADAEIAQRTQDARRAIPLTLAAIKEVAEAGSEDVAKVG